MMRPLPPGRQRPQPRWTTCAETRVFLAVAAAQTVAQAEPAACTPPRRRTTRRCSWAELTSGERQKLRYDSRAVLGCDCDGTFVYADGAS
ncbi:hypothetical protein niasHT_020390 [Heterodera trifolii]|uniref:Uncharacterized protein n=1 Tax=Heterodera trifolii TaxID=157864 RepID=A0ABD2JXE4_9BILA